MNQRNTDTGPLELLGSSDRTAEYNTQNNSLSDVQINRKQFLPVALRNLWRIGEAPVLIGPFILSSMILMDRAKGENSAVPEIDPKKPDQLPFQGTDIRIELENGGNFRNLGVDHSIKEYRKHPNYFQKAVKDADVVLLEGGNRNDSHKYFGILRDGALDQKKIVYNIDMSKKDLAAWTGIASNLLGVAAGSTLLWDFYREEKSGKTLGLTRRSILRMLGLGSVMLGYPSPPAFLGIAQGKHTSLDFAYITDGRTVKMLDNTLKVIERHQGQKILVITGDQHAKGFAHYLSSPENYQDFEQRKKIYFSTYEQVFGRDLCELKSE